MNTFFVAAAALVPATVVPLNVLSSISWNRGFETYEMLHEGLLKLADAWTGGPLELDSAAVAAAEAFVHDMSVSMHWFK